MKAIQNRRSFLQQSALAATATAVVTPSFVRAAAPTDKVVMAIVGCAHIHTPGFVNLLKGRSDVTVAYVWDPDQRRAERWAKELGAQVVGLAQIWGDPHVQAVLICSETNRHSELVSACAKSFKHMFVEKPLAASGRESYAMARAIANAGVLFTTGYFMRTLPANLMMKQLVAEDAFGKITRIEAWNCHSGSLGGWFDEKPENPAESWRWMANPKIAGVGAFGDLGTHSLDIMMWILGDVVTVSSDIRIITGRYADCDETGQSLLKFKSGISGYLAAGWVDVANPIALAISGTEGYAMILNDKVYARSNKHPGWDLQKPITDLPKAPPAPLHQFVDSVKGAKGLPLVQPAEAAGRVAVMEAMYKANRTQRWEKVA